MGTGVAPSEVVVGVDVGTTAAKVSVFGLGSPWRHTAVREYPLLRPAPGREEQDPGVLAAAMLDALAEAVSAARAGSAGTGVRVVAVALSSAMHGLIGLDAASRPLTPLVTWADSRARDEAAALRASGDGLVLHRRSGTPVHPMSPLTKLLWFRRHSPELFARVAHWVGLKDWMVLTLTGELATELSSASATGLLDLATGTWSPATLDLAGVTADQLPPVLATTAALGLSPDVARRVGLPIGTPVVLGAGDGPLGNLGTGALDPGIAGLSIGTSGAVRAAVPRPGVDERGVMFCYALTQDTWVVGGAISNGGSVLRWARDVFGAAGPSGPTGTDEEALALAATVPPGSDGLVALPFLMAERAPLWDPTLTGGFLGMRAGHTRAHFVRACVEGVALQLSTILAELDAVVPVTAVRATGGVFRSSLWRTVVADVLDRPVTVTDGAEGSALGAAALGLVGVGRAPTPRAALDLLRPPDAVDEAPTLPRPEAVATYRRLRATVPAMVRAYEPVAALLARPVSPGA
jgi:gluconokinase